VTSQDISCKSEVASALPVSGAAIGCFMPESAGGGLAGGSAGSDISRHGAEADREAEREGLSEGPRFSFDGKDVLEAPHHLGNTWGGLLRSWNLGITGGLNM
jgi:hypothetical protein